MRTKSISFLVLIFSGLIFSSFAEESGVLLDKAVDALTRLQPAEAEEILSRINSSSLPDDASTALYFFSCGKAAYYRMEFSTGIEYMKKSIVLNSIYREWALYYIVMMSYMMQDYQSVEVMGTRYGRDIRNFMIKKSVDYMLREAAKKR